MPDEQILPHVPQLSGSVTVSVQLEGTDTKEDVFDRVMFCVAVAVTFAVMVVVVGCAGQLWSTSRIESSHRCGTSILKNPKARTSTCI